MSAITEYVETKNDKNTTNPKSWDMPTAISKRHTNPEGANDNSSSSNRALHPLIDLVLTTTCKTIVIVI